MYACMYVWQGIITTNGGENCEEFDAIHSVHAHKMLQEYYLGDVVEEEEEVGR